MKNQWLFSIVDRIPSEDLKRLGGRERNIMAVWTGEKRPPKSGEWFISGAVPEVYRARADLTTVYHIARLVQVERKEVVRVVQ